LTGDSTQLWPVPSNAHKTQNSQKYDAMNTALSVRAANISCIYDCVCAVSFVTRKHDQV
jgi:hypothetical protein